MYSSLRKPFECALPMKAYPSMPTPISLTSRALTSREILRALVKTSLGIWALGPMVTRFVPGGYQPEHAGESTALKVSRAVGGLGDLIDDYEFHYPQELDEENLDEVRAALGEHGIYAVATGTHLNPLFGRGALSSPDDSVRNAALAEALHAADFAASVGAQMILWPGIEGYNYPFQTPYRESWARFVDGVGEVAARCQERGITLFLEHKNSEPAMKILMRNIGMTLHVIHTLRAPRDHEREGQHGLAAPAHERGEPRRVRGAARRRGPARPPARELGLGHVRRRQHGRSDRVHGDARARRRAAPGGLRGQRRAPRVRPLPVHRGRRGGGEAECPAVALHRLGRGEDRRRGAPRGAAAQGRGARLRAGVRGPRRSDDLSVGLDVGTTGVKALAITPDGEVVASAEEHYGLSSPQPGWSEQDPEDWWRASQAALARLGVAESRVGLSGQMHGLVCLDERGEVLRPAILWNDQRTAAECAEIEERVGLERLIALTGNRALTGFTAPKLLWLRRHEPRGVRAHPPDRPPQGLRPPPADRRLGDRRRRCLRDAALRRREEALVGRGRWTLSRSRPSGFRR